MFDVAAIFAADLGRQAEASFIFFGICGQFRVQDSKCSNCMTARRSVSSEQQRPLASLQPKPEGFSLVRSCELVPLVA